MKKTFRFRNGSPFRSEEAQSVGEFLSRHFPDEKLTPRQVLDLARPKKSPIHKFFDWDDSTAAEKYRLRQARDLISALFVIVDDGPIKAYEVVRFQPSGTQSYATTELISQDSYLTDQVIENAKRELLYWEAKYSHYKDKLPLIFSAIERMKQEQA